MKNQIIRAVEVVGSQKALAESLGVSHQTVWAWISRGRVPHCYGAQIEKATSGTVSRHDLWPDDWKKIWPELRAKK